MSALRVGVLAMLAILWPEDLTAHDPDAWGGLFRSHDAGATWTPINPGIFVSGALALAVSPGDPNHLLLATDSGVWRSRNAGRDWQIEAPDILTGPAFAVAFDVDGERALVATSPAYFSPRRRSLAVGPNARRRRSGARVGGGSGGGTSVSGRHHRPVSQ